MHRGTVSVALILSFATACSTPRPTTAPASALTPRRVTIEQGDDGRWQLLRNGEPYVLKGAGAQTRFAELAEAGATSFRTWGVGADTRATLDEAEELGLSVALGIWLGHVENGFRWHDEERLQRQRQAVRDAVLAYRDHPALLVWGIGNEMELDNDDPVMWREVGALVRMVEELDPNHPTMVVTAELGEANADRLREHVPDVDIWGINSYGGIHSLTERLDATGWDRPFIVTELGNHGDWEVGRTSWGAPLEPTSTEKAAMYRAALSAAVDDPRCVGQYAFHWGRGRTPSDTWFALLGPGDVRYEPVDVLVETWTGRPPSDRSPTIRAVAAPFANTSVEPGAPLTARLDAEDPEGEPLRYAWMLTQDALDEHGNGPPRSCTPVDDGTMEYAGVAPTVPGPYRLVGFVRDPAGHAAYAVVSFAVAGTPPAGPSAPFWVDSHFAPSGWMGDASDRVTMTECVDRVGFCQGPCKRFAYRGGPGAANGWAAVAWMHPEGNWRGRQPGVPIPPDARAVEFMAWGEEGGETVTFSVGNGGVDGFSKELRDLELTTEPTRHRIQLDAGVRDDVVFGFGWARSDPGPDGLAFYVADIRWVAD